MLYIINYYDFHIIVALKKEKFHLNFQKMEKYLRLAPKRPIKQRWSEDFLLKHEEQEKSLYRYWIFKPYDWSLKKTCIPEDWIPIGFDIFGLRRKNQFRFNLS